MLDFVTLGYPILFSSDNKTLRPSKPPRLKLNSKCFSANALSQITVCLDAYDLDFPLTFVFAVCEQHLFVLELDHCVDRWSQIWQCSYF